MMAPITPTLGQLREKLNRDGMPGPREWFTFDLEDVGRPKCSCPDAVVADDPEDYSPKCLTCGERAYLPDCWVVDRRTCELLLDGRYDHLPEQTPLQELVV